MRLSEIKKISGPETEVLGWLMKLVGSQEFQWQKKFNQAKYW